MQKQNTNNRMVWLVIGVLAGLCISYFWPHEPVSAATSDRDTNFGLITVPVRDVTIAGVRDTMEGVFVIDYLTGRLQGAVINPRIGKFTSAYFRNLAADFKVDPQANPHYTLATGTIQLAARGQATWANAILYVGELNSGMIHAYAFSYTDNRVKGAPVPLVLMDGFRFRQPM